MTKLSYLNIRSSRQRYTSQTFSANSVTVGQLGLRDVFAAGRRVPGVPCCTTVFFVSIYHTARSKVHFWAPDGSFQPLVCKHSAYYFTWVSLNIRERERFKNFYSDIKAMNEYCHKQFVLRHRKTNDSVKWTDRRFYIVSRYAWLYRTALHPSFINVFLLTGFLAFVLTFFL